MKMIKVKSSNIRSVGYSANLFQLVVEFKATDRSKAKVFAYEDVNHVEFNSLLQDESIGKVFHSSIKMIKECHEIDCDVIDGALHARDLILDKVEPSKLSASPWISVDDAMPEGNEAIDVWAGGMRHADCQYSQKRNGWYDELKFKLNDVTHWMPLPEPPTT